MTNKLNNLSTLVPYQLPEFIREDHPGIVAFIEAYYEWLDAETVASIKKGSHEFEGY